MGTKKFVLIVIVGMFFCVFCCGIVSADGSDKLIYVNDNATGIQDGSQMYPFATIQQAVDACEPGITNKILIHGGKYKENILVEKAKTIIISGIAGEVVIVRPKDISFGTSALGITGLTGGDSMEISNIVFAGEGYAGIQIEDCGKDKGKLGPSINIHHCSFTTGIQYQFTAGLYNGIIVISSMWNVNSKLNIYNNTFSGNICCIWMNNTGEDSMKGTNGAGINVKIFNNIFYGSDQAVYAAYTNACVFNDTFFKPYVALYSTAWYSTLDAMNLKGEVIYFYNNIVYLPKMKGIICDTFYYPYLRIMYNDIDTTKLNMIESIGNNVGTYKNFSADPKFVDLITPNLHLQSSSPCKDSGNGIAGKDKDGTATDMGAYGGQFGM